MDAHGVYISKDDGLNWTSVNSGLLDQNVKSLFVKNSYLYAGTEYSGVWCRPISEILTDVKENQYAIPNIFYLEQNYPNPFNPSTTLRYSLPQSSQVQIKVSDVLGNEIETIVNEEKPVGTYELSWNAANLTSGVYFYRLQAGSFVQTRKMILLK